jgi:hypothetical protein
MDERGMKKRQISDRARRPFPSGFARQKLLQFWEARIFTDAWQELKLSTDDLLDLQMEIILNPDKAPVIPGTGRMRKLRFSPEGWRMGKSGALRVCYVHFEEAGEVLLALVYPKSDKDNLTMVEKAVLRKMGDRQQALYDARAKNRPAIGKGDPS